MHKRKTKSRRSSQSNSQRQPEVRRRLLEMILKNEAARRSEAKRALSALAL